MSNGRRMLVTCAWVACLAAGLMAFVASAGLAAGLPSQEGLPAALALELKAAPDGSVSKEDLRNQVGELQRLADWASAHRPKTGFLQSLFGSKGTARPVALGDLAQFAQALKGERVVVEGLYERSKEATGEFRLGDARCLVNLAEGALKEGFAGEDVYGLPVAVEGTVEMGSAVPIVRAQALRPAEGLALLRIARAYELMGEYTQAVEAYAKAEAASRRQSRDFAAFAGVSAGRIAYENLRDKPQAGKRYNAAWSTYLTNVAPGTPAAHVWMPGSGGQRWQRLTVREAIGDTLDQLNSQSFWYRFVALFTDLCGGNSALACLLIALVVRIVIWPLTKKQLQSGEAMKRLQPQIKELQTRHADDKQKFQQEFWKLCNANKVNPLGGCLPLLVQMPLLIMVYNGIRLYIVQFDKASFLWVQNLAGPDMVLLVAYTLSMIAFQKMTQATNPQAATMDPQQEQTQKMMMYMMPLMFFFMFKTFPAAFILYWLGTNVIYFAQQWNYARRVNAGHEAVVKSGRGGGFAASVAKLLSGEPGGREQGGGEEPKATKQPPAPAKGPQAPSQTAKRDKRKSGKGKRR